ncbi:serine hydrolase domain-containing protein [Catellatospora bangladeshensis]|uniref:Serine hydrolase n=1 Tax=Catellatospora bangladeshensis TaxID=310355 RepID=A0A8J3NKA3_9ACTN|nr:serine hydrolase domain-containing protein [Catellatospora bangladeshensis]GIF82798.1 serine hydrolase [Catellatospora bangladeshensis]
MTRRTVHAAFGAAVALVLLAGAVPAQAATGTLRPQLEAITAAGMPGVFAQAADGRRRESAAAGVADVTTGAPTTPGMRHRVGSITKTFTATVLLQLVGEGRLRLDAPIGRYLPDHAAAGVTVRMLLNHTSGIADYDHVIFATDASLEENRHRTFAPAELAAIGLQQPRTGEPGAAWAYSNTNYVLAGMILERITGRTVAHEIDKRIIRPLDLRHTYLPGTAIRIRGPHAAAYIPWYGGVLLDFADYNMSWAWAAGELVSTTGDLNTFYRALLTGRLLRPALLAQMQTTVPWVPGAPEYGGYGLGLYSNLLSCGLVWGHDGLVLGHSAISWHTADGRRQVTVAQNMTHYVAPGQPDPITDATIAMLNTQLCGEQPATARAAVRPHLADQAILR